MLLDLKAKETGVGGRSYTEIQTSKSRSQEGERRAGFRACAVRIVGDKQDVELGLGTGT